MKIGIVGAGQLGLMIAEAANEMGHTCVALDPSPMAPAYRVCESYIVAAYDDEEALTRLCEMCDVVTYEFENIPGEVLRPLCNKYNIKQGCDQLLKSQDRFEEKRNAEANGLTTQKYYKVDDKYTLMEAVEKLGLPAVLKSRRMGYDGHGQMVLRVNEDILWAETNGYLDVPCILEEWVDFDYEVSTIIVRSQEQATVFPVGRNIHRGGVLDLSCVPSQELSRELRDKIVEGSLEFMRRCEYYGILAIEYFVKGDRVIFNEMAPRPHNSGHYSIEGTTESQFAELVRYLTDEPLKGTELVAESVVMKNIIGSKIEAAREIASERIEGCYVHDYGKAECKEGRKMGHITYVDMTEERFESEWAKRF